MKVAVREKDVNALVALLESGVNPSIGPQVSATDVWPQLRRRSSLAGYEGNIVSVDTL